MKAAPTVLNTGMAVILACGLLAIAACDKASAGSAQLQASDLPSIQNARLETRALTATLAAELKTFEEQSGEARWIGYSVAQVAGDREVCCAGSNGNWNQECGSCRLESSDHGINMNSHSGSVNLEAPHAVAILFRALSSSWMSAADASASGRRKGTPYS